MGTSSRSLNSCRSTSFPASWRSRSTCCNAALLSSRRSGSARAIARAVRLRLLAETFLDSTSSRRCGASPAMAWRNFVSSRPEASKAIRKAP